MTGTASVGLDLAAARGLLDRSGAMADGQRVTRVELLGAKRGRRATYRVRLANPGEQLTIKCFADARRARLAADAMASLGAALGPASRFRVVHLIGQDTNAVVYRTALGQRLDVLVLQASPGAAGRLAAGWLAALHGSGAVLDRTLDPDQEWRTAETWLDALACATWGLGPALDAAYAELAERRPPPTEAPVPIHKDFHHGHLYVAPDDTVAAIDLDECRLGPAEFDVAHFTTNLEVLALLRGSTRPQEAARAFRSCYAATTGWTSGADHHWWRTYCLVKLAWQVLQGVGPPPMGEHRHRGRPEVMAAILGLRPIGVES